MRSWFRYCSISPPSGQHQLGVLQYDLDDDHPEVLQTPYGVGSVPGNCPTPDLNDKWGSQAM